MSSHDLLPPNATPQELALSAVVSRDVPIQIREMWNPNTCPESLLPWLAWAFSVDRWDDEWPEEQKRAVVAAAVRIHKRKGTRAAVQEVVDLILGGGEILEAWEFDGDPYTFKIKTTGQLQSQADYDRLTRLIETAKPVRAWLLAAEIHRKAKLDLRFATYTRTALHFEIHHKVAPNSVDPCRVFLGAALQSASVQTVLPQISVLAAVRAPLPITSATATHRASMTTLRFELPSHASAELKVSSAYHSASVIQILPRI